MPVAFDAVAAADNGHELWSSPAPTKGTGFVHRVFTMYHATFVAAAKEILRCGGLRVSNGSGNMLGAGVYATHTYEVRRETACQTFKIANFENVTVSQIPGIKIANNFAEGPKPRVERGEQGWELCRLPIGRLCRKGLQVRTLK